MKKDERTRIAVVIPSYRVKRHIMQVIAAMPSLVTNIYVIDDACPEGSGDYVEQNCDDERVLVIRHPHNRGVGGAVITGYQQAIADGAEVIVKVDGDGQMDPALIPAFVAPIIAGEADYTKGNRFFDLEATRSMPTARLIGNAGLSLLCKISSGYWGVFDPTNGYTAIHSAVAGHLPFAKISKRYFFETDILFRLNILRAVVVDVPMDAVYKDEVSNLKIHHVFFEFLAKNARNATKRVFYNYYLRDMSIASLELPIGAAFLGFGLFYGAHSWLSSARSGVETPAGTVMLAALPVIAGMQFLLSFVGYDMTSAPNRPVHRSIRSAQRTNREHVTNSVPDQEGDTAD